MQIECIELTNISNLVFNSTRYRNGVRGRIFHISISNRILSENNDAAILKVTCSTPDKMFMVHWV
jgi:hypothetical protein